MIVFHDEPMYRRGGERRPGAHHDCRQCHRGQNVFLCLQRVGAWDGHRGRGGSAGGVAPRQQWWRTRRPGERRGWCRRRPANRGRAGILTTSGGRPRRNCGGRGRRATMATQQSSGRRIPASTNPAKRSTEVPRGSARTTPLAVSGGVALAFTAEAAGRKGAARRNMLMGQAIEASSH